MVVKYGRKCTFNPSMRKVGMTPVPLFIYIRVNALFRYKCAPSFAFTDLNKQQQVACFTLKGHFLLINRALFT